MTIVEALKNIYNKWTGKTSEGNTIEEVLGELNADYTPGSGGGEETITINNEIGNVPETSDVYVVELEDARFAKITRKSNVVINGHDMTVVPNTVKVEFSYNLDPETSEPTGSPAIFFAVDETDNNKITYSTDVNPSNSTLTIVVTNGGGLPSDNDFPVTAVLTAGMAIDQVSKDTHAIKAAFDAGKKVHLVIDGSVLGAFIDLPLTEIASDDSAWFGGIISLDSGTAQAQGYMLVRISENDDPDFSLFGVPTPSAANIGKILGVVSDGRGGATMSWLDSKVPLIVSGTFAEGSPATVTITAELADIYAAADAGRAVYLEYTNTDGQTGEVDTTRLTLHTRSKVPNQSDPSVYDYGLGFYMPYMESNKPAVGEVMFANSKVGIFDFEAAQ